MSLTISSSFPRSVPRFLQTAILPVTLLLGVVSCKDLTGSGGLPAGTPDPSVYNTAAGAIGLRNSAIAGVEHAVPQFIADAGLLTDEFEDSRTGASTGLLLQNGNAVDDPLDERILPEGTDNYSGQNSYDELQDVRGESNLAIHALAAYDTAAADTVSQKVMRGELYAMEGYAEILLADLFCSGVPLSTLDFQKDFTYAPSSSTDQVYQDALLQLQSAQTLSVGNDTITNLVRVLRGRAYLARGQYDSAAAAVAAVPTGFQYRLTSQSFPLSFMSDGEGGNGLPYRSSGDPRTADTVLCIPPGFYNNTQCSTTWAIPKKYAASVSEFAYVPFVVADWIEARLIMAEAQLQPDSQPSNEHWLTTLNQLRKSIQLPDTSDPGTSTGRIALLFRERAFWLYATGHRQGDLRRLLRQYGPSYSAFESDQKVYPSGTYTAPGTGRYGTDVTAPIPTTENANPYFHGCQNRNP